MPPTRKSVAKKTMENAAAEQFKAAWHDFPELPGRRLSMRKTGRRTYELVNDDSRTIATCSGKASRRFPLTITTQGRTYAWRRVGERRLMASARVRELVNVATNAPVLRMRGTHFDHSAYTRITIGQHELQFPVVGTRQLALMSAIDQSGNSLIEYRLDSTERRSRFDNFGWAEVVVNPAAMTIPHIELVVAVSRAISVDLLPGPYVGRMIQCQPAKPEWLTPGPTALAFTLAPLATT